MEYKIVIISTPGFQINKDFALLLKKNKENISVIINRQENIIMLDINELLRYFYEEFDGVFIITHGKIIKGVVESKYKDFQSKVRETNRILTEIGLTDGRIKICNWDGKDYRSLNSFILNSFKNLIRIGPNPIKFDNFEGIQLKKLIYATYKASNNFRYRSLFKAKEDILKIAKYSEEDLNLISDSIFEAETTRNYIFEDLKNLKLFKVSKIINRFPFPKENIIRNLFYMKEKGLIELIDTNNSDPLFKFRDDLKRSKENYFISVESIYDSHLCCQCGLCSSICPVNAISLIRDYLYIDDSKCITCGLCYEVCPRSFHMNDLIENKFSRDKSIKYTKGLGYYKNIYSAKTVKYSIKKVGQDGGIVTSLLYYLLEKKLVDAVITIKHLENYWEPKVSIIEKVEDLYKTAGSTYVHFPVLSILHKAKKYDKIALVALPCKIKALSKGELIPIKLPMFKNIAYKIGLFCMKSFPYEQMFKLIKDKFSVTVDEIIKMDINSGRFELTVDSGERYSLPLDECNIYTSEFCHFCGDLTAEFADISLGSIGSDEGWSTVITRSHKGEKIFKGALKNNLIEIKSSLEKSPIQSKIRRLAEKKQESTLPVEIHAF